MTTIATAAADPEDCRPREITTWGEHAASVTVNGWGAQQPSSVDQAVRYTDEQIDTLNQLSIALLEKARAGPGPPPGPRRTVRGALRAVDP